MRADEFTTATARLVTWSWFVPMAPSCGSPYAELGYRMPLVDSHGSAEREAQGLAEFTQAGVSGVVGYPAQGHANTTAYAGLHGRGIPLVLVDRAAHFADHPGVRGRISPRRGRWAVIGRPVRRGRRLGLLRRRGQRL